MKPLSKEDGTPSDHDVVAAKFKLPKQARNTKIEFAFRPITTDGIDMFKDKLLAIDWNCIERESASESAEELDRVLQKLVKEFFPEKTRRINSNDAP